jgi:hypothetical protein
MAFVDKAAEDFDKLLRKRPGDVERSLKQIYLGHGIH